MTVEEIVSQYNSMPCGSISEEGARIRNIFNQCFKDLKELALSRKIKTKAEATTCILTIKNKLDAVCKQIPALNRDECLKHFAEEAYHTLDSCVNTGHGYHNGY